MSALGRFGRFTLFSPRVSPSKHLPFSFCFVLCFGFGVFVALLCFCFLFCKCFGIPNSPRSLDLDDRQGLIASSAMQQKKKSLQHSSGSSSPLPLAQGFMEVRSIARDSHSILSFRLVARPTHRALQTNSIGFGAGCSYQSSVGRRVAIVRSFRERGAPSTHRHHGPELVSRHIHIFTTPAVRVQH